MVQKLPADYIQYTDQDSLATCNMADKYSNIYSKKIVLRYHITITVIRGMYQIPKWSISPDTL